VKEVEKIAGYAAVYTISSKTGVGLEELNEYLKPRKTIVFLGSSGVGKSSLVNALAGEEVMKVNNIREDDSKGRHTTTHRQLIKLENGVMIIDTPGMRELGMWDVTEGIGEAFSDIDQYMGKCKFNNCSHQNEPGCAIKEAMENGELSLERWESYNKLKKEARYSDNKVDYSIMDKKAGKQFSKWNKQQKKAGKNRN
jgi:ribosome biogenesis GTPase